MPITEAEPGTRLSTARLVLRPVGERDIAPIVQLGGAREVAEMTLTMPHPLTEADARSWLADRGAPGERVFAIERAADGAFLGVIGVHGPGEGTTARLGYWVGRPYWNRGYATEAVLGVVRHAFEGLGVDGIEAEVFPHNGASVRVLEKAGFAKDREDTRAASARGGDRPVVVYALERQAFRGQPPDVPGRP